jgi:hypothetical protein
MTLKELVEVAPAEVKNVHEPAVRLRVTEWVPTNETPLTVIAECPFSLTTKLRAGVLSATVIL